MLETVCPACLYWSGNVFMRKKTSRQGTCALRPIAHAGEGSYPSAIDVLLLLLYTITRSILKYLGMWSDFFWIPKKYLVCTIAYVTEHGETMKFLHGL